MNQYLDQHIKQYPQRTWQDDIKWLYQGVLGCEHFVSDFDQSLKRIKAECGEGYRLEKEVLSDDFIRVHFSGLNDIEASVLNRLFIESANMQLHTKDDLQAVLRARKLQYALEDQKLIEDYILEGCPSVHHSDQYRDAYAPHYRVIYRSWWPFFDLLCHIEKMESGIVGIDGRCGSGKSTLGGLISRLYHCPLIHMDDFYLPLKMRTKERLSEPGGNVFYERFDEEVMAPIQRKERLHYGVFDHRVMDVGTYCDVALSNLYVIEGSYAFHPTLVDNYDFKVFMTIDPEDQKRRIMKRNGLEEWKMFEARWIPLEEHYFAQRDFFDIAEISINVSEYEDLLK